jgi:3-oxoacyl-[acyl-carrier-protein] synthase II
MTAYIEGSALISPQNTFGAMHIPADIISYTGVNYLKCIEPAYSDYIDPMASRRMSRIVKQGVCCALKCMHDAGMDIPDAIITGTGLGCIEDTEKFLGSIYSNDEKLLNPTPFIQSTHNTIAGAIALAIKCFNYNTTYAHRGFSFESALQDTLLHLSENPELKILTGGFDEVTPNSYTITRRLGMWKTHPVNNLDLCKYGNRGSLPGEGVAFYLLSGIKRDGDTAMIKSLKTFYKPDDYQTVGSDIVQFLEESDMKAGDIDLAVLGINGDAKNDGVYDHLMQNELRDLPCAYYKHLCGEYDTSSAFALWLSSMILKDQNVPDDVKISKSAPKDIKNILIYNHLRNSDHALYLLSRC